MNSFFKELSQKKVIITLGTGGVGKTTLSASVGMKCALLGKKVLVSTIDPAKRLVTALSLDSLSGEPQKVELDLKNGEFYAMMLDMKSAWDNLIIRNVSSAQKRQKILSNKFYHHLSTRLAGSLEYMALSKLFDLYKSGDYDVVIIDTPPLANAMDFLDAPKKIHDFVDHQAMKWLFSPAIGKGALKFFKFC